MSGPVLEMLGIRVDAFVGDGVEDGSPPFGAPASGAGTALEGPASEGPAPAMGWAAQPTTPSAITRSAKRSTAEL